MKARAGKKAVVLELGGNAAAIIEDYRGPTELEAIIPKLTFGAFYQSGQSCISLQRLFVRHVSALGSSGCDNLQMEQRASATDNVHSPAHHAAHHTKMGLLLCTNPFKCTLKHGALPQGITKTVDSGK